jgi:hypothetical protein
LADTGLNVLTADGWTIVPFSQLPNDRSSFPKDLQDALRRQHVTASAHLDSLDTVSFTTTDGHHYDDVRAQPTDDGLSVLTADGWTAIPAQNLPADLSPFPVSWRRQLRDAAAPHDTSSHSAVVTFTSNAGQHYDEVRASVEDDGLHLTTADGLILVPWKQIPDDLSVFPAGWREKIASARKTAATAVPTASISH